MRIAVQRRLGLPLLDGAAAAAGNGISKHGKRFDRLGDVAPPKTDCPKAGTGTLVKMLDARPLHGAAQ